MPNQTLQESKNCWMWGYWEQRIRAHVVNELINHIEEYCDPDLWLTWLLYKRIAALGFLLFVEIPRVRENIERFLPDIISIRTHCACSLVFNDVLDVKGNRTANVSIFKTAEYFVKNIFSKNLQVTLLQHPSLILRKEYPYVQQEFTGSFPTIYESSSIPPILKSFWHMLLDGSGIDQSPSAPVKSKIKSPLDSRLYSTVRHRYKNPGSGPRHIIEIERETPASLYVALKLYLQTAVLLYCKQCINEDCEYHTTDWEHLAQMSQIQ